MSKVYNLIKIDLAIYMRIKREILLIIAIIFVAMIGGVSAADDNQTSDVASVADDSPTVDTKTNHTVDVTTVEDESSIEEEDSVIEEGTIAETENDKSAVLAASSNDDVLGVPADQEVLGATLRSLQTAINNAGNTLNLYEDYTVGNNNNEFMMAIINKNLVINGNNHILDAKNNGGIIYIYNGVTVTFNDLTFSRAGYTSTDYIRNQWGYFYPYLGGAVHVNDGCTVTFNNCKFLNNARYSYGGAVTAWNGGTFTFNNCEFTGNSAYMPSDSDETYGGAIFAYQGGTFRFTNCDFTSNTAKDGAILKDFGNGNLAGYTFTDCDFINNGASDTAAIYLNCNQASFDKCNLINNSGYQYGAIYVYSSNNPIRLTNSNFTGNKVSGVGEDSGDRGGVIRLNWVTSFYVDNCIFKENSASYGGAIYAPFVANENCQILNSKFIDNIVSSNGGAIYWNGNNTIFRNLEFINNSGENGAALYFGDNLGNTIISNCNFTENKATGQGGGIRFLIKVNNADITNCLFDGNIAINGAGISMGEDVHDVLINKCNFTDNHASSYGGAIYFQSYGDGFDITNSNFNSNFASSGGAIHFFSSRYEDSYNDIDIINCNFTKNICTSSDSRYGGSSIGFNWANDININKCNFEANSASASGAVLLDYCYDVSFNECEFSDNSAGRYGGAIYFFNIAGGSNASIVKCNFNNNSATRSGGAISTTPFGVTVKTVYENWKIIDCEFIDNHAILSGGAAYLPVVNNITITNNKFDNNSAQSTGALYLSGNLFNGYNLNFTNNKATNGDAGALFIATNPGSTDLSTFNKLLFENNTAYSNGGAISGTASNVDITNADFNNNSAWYGGAIYWTTGSNININHDTFTLNTANNAGAIDIYGAANTNISYCDFINNSATNQAGAVWLNSEGGSISYCDFTNNNAGGNGGAVIMDSNRQTLQSCNFIDNTAGGKGGAIYDTGVGADNSNTIKDSTFVRSKAYDGGAVYITDGRITQIYNDTFIDNLASHNGGGAYVIVDAIAYVDYDLFKHTGIYEESTSRIDWSVGSRNVIYSSLFENNNIDYYMDVSAVVSGLTAVITVTVPVDANKSKNGKVVFDITYTNQTGSYKTQYVLNNFEDNPGTITLNLPSSEVGHYDVIVQFSEDTYLMKQFNVSYNVTDPRGDFEILQGLINDAIANHFAELDLTRSYTFTPGNETNPLDFNVYDIEINAPLIINGHGWTINSLGYCRIFAVNGANVVLNDLKIINGNNATDGGAIYWAGSNGTVRHTEFTNNTATHDGGAIYFAPTAADSKVINCTFEDNRAGDDGGAIDWNATRGVLNDSEFINNAAGSYGGALCREVNADGGYGNNNVFINNTAGEVGGAIAWMKSESITINNYDFINNTAGYSGGAIYVGEGSGNCVVKNSYFEANEVIGEPGHGGAIEWYSREGAIDNSEFVNNKAYKGGAVFVGQVAGDINITNSVFTNNTALTHGGAVDANASSVIMEHSQFYNNTAEYGGALYVGGAGEHNSVGYCLFIGNNATENGGAIDWAASNGNVLESTFEYNHAKNGGAVYVGGLAEEGSVINSTFNHNSADVRGGAVCWNATIGRLTGSTFFNNSAQLGGATYRGANSTGGFGYDNVYISNKAELDGGAIYWNGAGGNITYSEFHDNIAGRNGGAVYVGAVGATAYITDAIFDNNTAGENGGAVDWAASNGHILRSTFEYNDAGTNGGAVFIGGSAEGGSVINSTFNHNTAKEKGGAIDWNSTIGRLTGSTFLNNSAQLGGATYRGANSTGGYGYDNVYTDNHAEIDGGAIYWNSAGGNVTHSEFYNNTAGRNGGAVYVGANGATSYITDAKFVNNSAENRGGAVDWDASNGNVLRSTFEYNSADYGGAVFIGGTSGNGTIINSTFNHNHADENGGALDWNSTIGQLINSTFYNNTAKYGGATYRGSNSTGGYGYNNVYISNHAEINGGAIDWNAAGGNVTHSTFKDNTAGNDGGAVYVGAQGATTYITDATFENNDAGNNGGAVNWAASNGHILNSKFDYNDAVNNGGAVFIGGSSGNGTIINSTFNYNTAGENGGAIDWNSTIGKLIGSNFTFNSAKYGGATFRGANATGGYGYNNIYISNHAEINGGAIDWNATGGNITHSQFYNNTAGENGGALFVGAHGATAYITDAIFENNKAGNRGGAIDIYASNTHIINSNFTTNKADYGGAVFAGHNAEVSEITNSTFTSNSATYNGGAIDWNASSGRITDSSFDQNTAEFGGAVFVGASTNDGYVVGSNFTNNVAKSRGGAIDWNASNGHVNDSIFVGNQAVDGGAIYVGSGASNGHVYNSTFISNRADDKKGKGGAILFHTVDQVYVGLSNFTDNTADHAGAIYIDECNSAVIEASDFTANSANNDGAIHWEGHDGTLRDSTFTANSATQDAGAIGWKGVESDIYNVTFSKNTAGGKAGAIYWVNVTDDEIHNVTFTENQAFKGGAIYWDSGNGTIYDATFKSNVAFEEGGAVYINGLSGNALTNATFTSNRATGYFNPEGIEYGDGGAVYITTSDNMELNDLKFDNNAAALSGGAIYVNNTDDSELYGLTFNDNRANKVGGTIYWTSSSNDTIHDISINKSTAHDEGGAIYLTDMEATLEDIKIDQATASYASAGAIYANGNITINNATLTNFKSLNDVASAILFDGGNSTIANSTLTGNNAIVINEDTTVHVIKNTINDNPADGYAVLNGGTLYLEKNDFDDVIINAGVIKTQTYTVVLGNKTVNATKGDVVTLNATIVDDTKNNNIVVVESFRFHDLTKGATIPSTYSGRANYGTYVAEEQGKYIISADDVGLTNNTILTGTLVVKASNNIEFNITKINEGENVTIKVELLPPDNNFPYQGNISLTVDGKPYNVEIINGTGTLTLTNLSAGTYKVTATYGGDEFHNNATNETYFVVNLRETLINITVNNILYGQNATAVVTTNANGTVRILINGNRVVEIVNGTATLNITDLAPGKYSATVIYPGNDYFKMNYNETSFEVYKNNAVIDSIEFARVVPVGTENTITVTMGNVTSGTITIEVNGVNYTAPIVNKVAKLNVTLPVGKDYAVNAYFLGDNYFNATNKTGGTFEVTDKNVTVINISSINVIEVDGRLVINFTTNTTAPLNVTINGKPVTVVNNSVVADTSAVGTYMLVVTSPENANYSSGYNSTMYTVIKHNSTVNITVDPVHYVGDAFTIIIGNNTNVTVTINGRPYAVGADGKVVIDTTQLPAGDYIVSAVIAENDKYYGNRTEATFDIVKYNATIDSVVVTPTVEVGQNLTVTVTMGNVTSGNVLIEVYGHNYTVPIVNGVAKTNITATKLGNNFGVTAYFLGDNTHNATSKAGNTFNVTGKYPTVIIINVTSVVEVDDLLIVNITTNTTAPLIVEVNGNPVTVNSTGQFIADTSVAGTYTITARTDEGEFYYSGFNSTTFNVIKHNSTVNVTVGPIHFVEDVFTINVTNNTAVVVTINGNTYDVNADGTVNIDTAALSAGEYIVTATIAENDKYYGNSSTAKFNIVKYNAEIISVVASPTIAPYGQNTTVTVTMGNVTSGLITIEVNGKNYTAPIVSGVATLDIGLPIGKYANVTAYFLGDYKYNATNKTGNEFEVTDKNITVITIDVESVVVVDSEVIVTLNTNTTAPLNVTVNGKPVTVVGNKFTADTSAAGTYTIVATAEENEFYSRGYNSTVYNVIKHNSTVDIAVDAVHFVNDTFTITVTSNTTVNVTINGKVYTVGADGQVAIDTATLPAGEYIVNAVVTESAKYYGNSSNATFKIVKYNAEITSVVATPIVANGQNTTITVTMANVTEGIITIEVNGVNYTVPIANSIATLNVSLPVGKDYPVTAYFLGDYKYNATSKAGNPFEVTDKNVTVINIESISVVEIDSRLLINVTANTTAPLTVTVNGKPVTLTNGQFVADTSVAGTYTIVATAAENEFYSSGYNSTTYKVIKHNSTVNITVDPVHFVGDNFTITVTSNTTVSVTINGKSYTVGADGKVNIDTTALPAGEYIVNAVVTESDKYYGNSTTATFDIVKYNAEIISVVAEPLVVPVGQNTTITVTMANVTSGSIVIEVNGVNYTVPIVNKVAKLNVSLPVGNDYPVKAYFLGDSTHNATSKVGNTFDVTDKNITVITIGVESIVVVDSEVIVTLTTNTTAPLNVTVNGKPVTVVGNKFTADTSAAGTYTIVATAEENEFYSSGFNSTTFTVIKHNSTVDIAVDPVHFVNDTFIITVTSNTTVNVTINGKVYTVGADGKVAIDTAVLPAGEYIINAVVIENAKYYGNSSNATFKIVKYNAEITSVVATPVVAEGQNTTIAVTMANLTSGTITIEVNGVNYTATINNNIAVLNVSLPVGKDYPVTAYFLGDYKYNATSKAGNPFEVTDKNVTIITIDVESVVVVDDKVIVTVTTNTTAPLNVTVNGKQVTLNSTGQFVADTSVAGTYNIVARAVENEFYSNGFNSTTFTVIKHNSTVDIAVDPIHFVGDDFAIIVTSNTTVNVTINGKTYAVGDNGKVSIDTTALEAGEYTVTATVYENDKYYGNATTATFNIVKYNATIDSVVVTPTTEIGQNITITVTMGNVTDGTVLIEVYGNNYTVPIVNSVATLNVTATKIGNDFPVTAYFLGDNKHNATSKAGNTFNVTGKYTTVINIDVESVVVVDDKVIVTVTTNTTAPLIVKVNGENVTLNSTGQFVANTSAAGKYTITAQTEENAFYSGAFNSTTYTVIKHNSTVDIAVGPVHFVNDTFTINVTSNATVNVTINGKVYTVGADGKVNIDTAVLPAGEYIVNAVVTESDKYYGNSSTATFNIVKYNAEIISVVAAPAIGPVGQNTTLTVTMGNVTTGTVKIEVNGVNYTVPIIDGVATLNVTLPVGKYTNVSAYFLGDYKYNATNKTGNAFEVTDKNITVITIDVESVVVVEDVVIVTVNTNTTAPLNVTVNGKPVTVVGNKFTADTSVAGTYTIVAKADESEFYSSGFNSTTFTVIKHNSTVDISVDPVHFVEDTFTIIVSSNTTVNVTINGKTYAVGADGKVDIDTTALPAGEYIVNAVVYENAKYYGNSTNATFTIVKHNAEIISVVAKPTIAVDGQNTTIAVTMGNVTSGTITIEVNGVNYTAPIVDSVATLNVTLPVGNDYTATAYFLGDDKHNATSKTSEPFFVTDKNVTVIEIESISVVEVDDTLIINFTTNTDAELEVTVNGEPVTLTNGQFTADTSVAGTYTVVVRSNETANYSIGYNSTVFKVIKHNSTVDIAVDPTHYVGDDFTIIVTNNTTVNVTINGKSYTVGADGKVSIDTTALPAGEYIVTATVTESDKYYGNTTTKVFNIVKVASKVNVTAENIVYGNESEITVKVPVQQTGYVTITVNNKNYTEVITNGEAKFTIPNLNVGTYTVDVTYLGDNTYNSSTNTTSFDVTKAELTATVEGKNITVDENSTFIVNVDPNFKGNVSITVDGVTYDGPVKSLIEMDKLTAGDKTATVRFYGDDNFNETTMDVNFKVSKLDTNMRVIDNGNGTVMVIVPDNATGNVTVKLGDKTYNATIVNGTAIVNMDDVPSGKYNVTVSYPGDDRYNNATVNASIEIKPKETPISVNVTNIKVGDVEKIIVSVPSDATGNITISIDGKPYIQPIVNGNATFTISDLTAGNKTVAVNYLGDTKYGANFTSAQFTVSKRESYVNVDVEATNVGSPVTISVEIPENATGIVIVNVDGTNYTVQTINGKGSIAINGVGNTTHTVKVTYLGDDQYLNSTNSTTYGLKKLASEVTVKVENIYAGETAVLEITVTDGATGNVTIKIGDEYQGTVGVTSGKITVNVPGLQAGDKTVEVTYNGDDKYLPSENSTTFEVGIKDAVILTNDVVAYYNETTFTARLADTDNNPIAGQEIVFKVNGQTYTAVTDEYGNANVTFELPLGKHTIETSYTDPKGKVINATNTITMSTSIRASDMTRGWNSPYDYYAVFLDGDGHVLVNKEVSFVINGKTYDVVTDAKGIAYLNTKLDVGKYGVTLINKVTGEVTKRNATIVKRLIENKDIVMDFRDGTWYTVKVIGDDGKPVGEGEIIDIYVNTIHYVCKTDKDGYARLLINLNPNTYTVSPEYKTYKVSNKLVVKQTLKLVKKTVKVKKGKKLVLKATLKWSNGKAIKGKKIVFKFKGKKYSAKTNSKGVAKVTIKKSVTKKLKKGKKYKYSAKYYTNYVKGKVKVK